MNKLSMLFIAGAVAAAGGLAVAQAQMGGTMDHGTMGHEAQAPGAEAAEAAPMGSPATQAYRAANTAMHEAMDLEFSDDADTDFARGMIGHHQGAIDMARIVLEHGEDPELRALAEEIIDAQEAEIAFLRDWLSGRGM